MKHYSLANFRNIDYVLCSLFISIGGIYALFHLYIIISKLSFSYNDIELESISDFFVHYSAARFIWEGGAAAGLYDLAVFKQFQIGLGAQAGGLHPFNYPPTYVFLILPLAGLSYAPAYLVWLGGTLLLFILAARAAGLRGAELAALAVAPAGIVNISAGQNGFLMSALLVAGLYLLERRPLVSGVLFGLLTVKPHLGLLVPVALLARCKWRVILVAGLTMCLMIGASLAVFGSGSWTAYAGFTEAFRQLFEGQAENSFVTYSATVLTGVRIAGLPASAAYLVQALVSVAVAVCLYRLYRATRDRTLQHAALLIGTLLASPFGFIYDLPFLSLAIVLLAGRGLREGFLPYERPVLAAGWLMPFIGSHLNDMGLPLMALVHLALFGLVVLRARGPRAAPAFPIISSLMASCRSCAAAVSRAGGNKLRHRFRS